MVNVIAWFLNSMSFPMSFLWKYQYWINGAAIWLPMLIVGASNQRQTELWFGGQMKYLVQCQMNLSKQFRWCSAKCFTTATWFIWSEWVDVSWYVITKPYEYRRWTNKRPTCICNAIERRKCTRTGYCFVGPQPNYVCGYKHFRRTHKLWWSNIYNKCLIWSITRSYHLLFSGGREATKRDQPKNHQTSALIALSCEWNQTNYGARWRRRSKMLKKVFIKMNEQHADVISLLFLFVCFLSKMRSKFRENLLCIQLSVWFYCRTAFGA